APTDWTLQYYDGSTWQVADTRSGITWSSNQTQTFDVAANRTSTRWRIRMTNPATQLTITEIEMMEAVTVQPHALGQSFQIGSASPGAHVRLWLDKVGSPTGNLPLKIQTNRGSNGPSGTVVTNGPSQVVAASTLGTSYGWVDFPFATPPSLSA